MTNPKPPHGWRIVDKSKDDPSDFDRIMLFCEGEWKEMEVFTFSQIDWMHYVVPIDPGPDHRLIDPEVDKPEDHPDAEVWLREGYGWTLRLQGDKCKHWCRNSVYRTPIKKAEPMPNEYDAEWFTDVPSEEEVGDNETCWFAMPINDSWEITGKAARSAKKLLAWTPRLKPKPYVPPKLPQPGEVWETRDGNLAVIVCKTTDDNGLLFGFMRVEGEWLLDRWKLDGSILFEPNHSPCDLIKHLPNEPWPQEIVR